MSSSKSTADLTRIAASSSARDAGGAADRNEARSERGCWAGATSSRADLPSRDGATGGRLSSALNVTPFPKGAAAVGDGRKLEASPSESRPSRSTSPPWPHWAVEASQKGAPRCAPPCLYRKEASLHFPLLFQKGASLHSPLFHFQKGASTRPPLLPWRRAPRRWRADSPWSGPAR